MRSVTRSMDELGQLTGQNVSLSERTGASVVEMQAQVERLAEVLRAFRLGDGAVSGATRPAAAPPRAAPASAPRPAVRAPASPAPARAAAASVDFF